jgi:hypothetical protein
LAGEEEWGAETVRKGAECSGIGHQTVSKSDKAERRRRDKAQAEALAERERQARLATASQHVVSFRRDAVGPIFFSEEHRLEYYWQRSLESDCDKLTYNDVRHGRLTPNEQRALAAGRSLFPR